MKQIILLPLIFFVAMFSIRASIPIYLILISIIIPSCFGNPTDNDHYVDNSLILIMMSCATVVQICTDLVNQHTHDRRFVSRNR